MYKISSSSQHLNATVSLPFSKSESNRALVIQFLSPVPIEINNLSNADDTILLQRLIRSDEKILDCGDGGTTLRFLLACKALTDEERIITGSNRLCNRPVGQLVSALNQLGANIVYETREGYPPLRILKGNIKRSEVEVDASISSQFISALILIAPVLPSGLKLVLNGKIISRSYIELTLDMMKNNGVQSVWNNDVIEIMPQFYNDSVINIGADWSAASYFFSMAAVAGQADLMLMGLSLSSKQPDRIIAEIIKQFGVLVAEIPGGVRILKQSGTVMPDYFEFDFNNCPDLAQTVAFMCAALKIPSKLTGLDTLNYKETERIKAIATELQKLNCEVIEHHQALEINPDMINVPAGINYNSYGDHRMIMSVIPLIMISGSCYIDEIKHVSKSFPGFWSEMDKLGISVKK